MPSAARPSGPDDAVAVRGPMVGPPDPPATAGDRPPARTARLTAREIGLLLAVLLGLGVLAAVGGGWLAVGVVYLAAVVFPGLAALGLLHRRWPSRSISFLEATLGANVLGLTLVMAIGWTAARLGLFAAVPVALAAVAVGIGLAVAGRRELPAQVRRAIANAAWDQFAFVGGLLGAAAAFLLPALLVLQSGSQIGGDTSFFTRIGDVLAHTGHWPDLSTVWQPFTSQADLAPGLPVLYATFGPVLGAPSLHLAVASNVLAFALAGLAMFLLVREFVGPRWVAYAAAAAWLFSFPDNTPLFNDLVAAGLPGFYPDAVASIAFYLLLATLLVRLVRSRAGATDQVLLLAVAFLGVTLLNQLTFLMAAVLIAVVGVYLFVRAGPAWTLKAAVVVFLPVLLFLPEYLVPASALTDTPATNPGHAITLATLLSWPALDSYYVTFGLLGLLGAGVALFGLGLAVVLERTGRSRTPLWDTRGALLLAVAGVVYLPLAFTPVGSTLLGIGSSRFDTYLGILAVPFAAVALVGAAGLVRSGLLRARARRSPRRLAVPRLGHTRSWVATSLVAGLFLVAAAQGVVINLQNETHDLGPGLTFSPDAMAAAVWIADHAAPGAVVAADGNSGNTGLTVLAVYCDHVVIYRPDFDLYLALTQSPYPSNLPIAVTNAVMTEPNGSNLLEAYNALNVQYYVLERGFSDKIIGAFSLLTYLPIVYQNSQIVVFEFVPSLLSEATFFAAPQYASASPLVSRTTVPTALNASNSVPLTANAISSSGAYGSAFDGSTVNYSTSLDPGIYTLTVHRYVYQTAEHVDVRIDGKSVGTIYFTSLGWTDGSLTDLVLAPTPTSITLTFEGTVGYADPIDYLTLAQG